MAVTMFSEIIDPVTGIVAELLRDENFRELVTYKKYTGQSFDATVGYTVNTYEDSDLYAVRMRHTKNSVRLSASEVEVGDVLFIFGGSDFPSDSSLKDVIEDESGNVFGIKGIDPVFEMATIVTVVSAK